MTHVYAVVRQNWRRYPDAIVRLPGTVEVQAFTDRDSAAAHAAELITHSRKTLNPFDIGESLFDITNLAPYALCDWLMDHDLTPPSPDADRRTWWNWWHELGESDRQCAWPIFHKLWFYDVHERPSELALVAYRVLWLGAANAVLCANYEGGQLQFAASQHADVHRWVEANTNPPDRRRDAYSYRSFHVRDRERFLGELQHEPPVRAIHAYHPNQVTSIPWCGIEEVPIIGKLGTTAHVLCRKSDWRLPTRSFWDNFFELGDEPELHFPLAVYGDVDAARAAAWECELETRSYLNPFRFDHPRTLTSLTECAYRQMLLELQLDLPATGWDLPPDYRTTSHVTRAAHDPAWIDWYENAVCLITDEQREMIWDLLDQLRFYTVVELEYRVC